MPPLRKKALCIGNNDYRDTTLGNLRFAINDAEAIGEKLSNLGFDVEVKNDLDGTEMAEVIGSAIDSLVDYDVFLLFYAGHGCQIQGNNYLIPIDAYWNYSDHGFAHSCISLSVSIMEELKRYPAVVKIVILDACRQFHDATRGIGSSNFAPISSPSDSLIALSTSPGEVATESADFGHGTYTNVLLRYIDMPHVNIETVFKRVRQDMVVETSGAQIPWEHTSLVKDFKLNPHYADDGMVYSQGAYSSEYRCVDIEARTLVGELRRGDFNVENEAVIRMRYLHFDTFTLDDIFFIGRSIFYAASTGACPSYHAQAFIERFDTCPDYSFSVKQHLLNGMAYESYFGTNNSNIERNYIVCRGYRLVLFNYLEKDTYSQCREFIAGALSQVEDRPVFIPGDDRIQFSVTLSEDFYVESVNHDGRQLLAENRRHLSAEEIRENSEQMSIKDFREKLSVRVNASSSCVDLVFDRDVAPEQEIYFLNTNFELLY